MMHGDGKSDIAIVPEKPPNKAGGPAAEVVEERAVAKGKRLAAGHAPDTEPGARGTPAGAGAGCREGCKGSPSYASPSPKARAGCGSAARPDSVRGAPSNRRPYRDRWSLWAALANLIRGRCVSALEDI